jgi:hypothetical protein
MNFNAVLTSFLNTPIINNSTVVDYLFESRSLHPQLDVNNPLGIQGLDTSALDDVISMLDRYILEHKQRSLERINYNSNILYILVNGLIPVTPAT